MTTRQYDPQAAVYISRMNRFIAASEFLRNVEEFITCKSMQLVAQNPEELPRVQTWLAQSQVYANEATKSLVCFERNQEVCHLDTAEKLINLIKE